MSRIKILVADDSATIQKVFELAFENEEIEVLLSSDGSEALEMITKTNPAMVIADVNMPGLGGFELCEALKKDEKLASIPVYLMSSALDDFDEARSKEVGAAGRFEKPFRSEEMVSQVREVIAKIKNDDVSQEAELDEVIEFPDEVLGINKVEEVIEDADSDEAEELVEVVDLAEPDEVVEDTFEDIDVSLDSIMDSMDNEEEMAGEEDSVIVVGEEPTETESAQEEIIVEDMAKEPEIMELSKASIVDDVDEVEAEDDLEVEIISSQDDGLIEDEIAGIELPGDLAVSEEKADEIMESDQPATATDAVSQDEIEPIVDLDELDDSDISAEGRQMLKAIDEEIEIGQTETEKELRAAGRIKEKRATDQTVDNNALMETAKEAFEEFVRSGGLHSMIEEAIQRFVKEMLTKEEFEEALSIGIKSAISEMKPRIMDDFRGIAQEMTLNVAEDLVKKTIDQIKTE